MKKFFHKALTVVFLTISLVALPLKTFALDNSIFSNSYFFAQQNTVINYEKSQPSAIDNPVNDPNFNVMRTSDMNASSALYFVIALVIAASIVPLASWYFSKSKANSQ